MTIVVGANGSGKSTLFDVFRFLKDSLSQSVTVAVNKRGGFKELVSRGEQGPIEFIFRFKESGGRLSTYQLEVSQDQGRAVVEREILKFRRGQRGKPWHLIDFSKGKGTVITNESSYGKENVVAERKEYVLDDPGALAIKALGQFKEFRVAVGLRSLIENWHISDFQISEARSSTDFGYAEHLSTRGENIPQVAQYLYQYYPSQFNMVLDAMKKRVPGVSMVKVESTVDGRLVLLFQDGSFKDPFLAHSVSVGTIKLFAILVLLYDPKPHPLLAVEGPENELSPELLHELIEEFRDYSRRGGQVFVSTHSPDFLDGARLDEVFLLTKKDGFTTIKRASESALLKNLVAEGDLPGALWRQGLFEGVGL